jgi:hypothetical protein
LLHHHHHQSLKQHFFDLLLKSQDSSKLVGQMYGGERPNEHPTQKNEVLFGLWRKVT